METKTRRTSLRTNKSALRLHGMDPDILEGGDVDKSVSAVRRQPSHSPCQTRSIPVLRLDMDPVSGDGPVRNRYASGLGVSSTSRTFWASTTGVNGFGMKAIPGFHSSSGAGAWSGNPELSSTFI